MNDIFTSETEMEQLFTHQIETEFSFLNENFDLAYSPFPESPTVIGNQFETNFEPEQEIAEYEPNTHPRKALKSTILSISSVQPKKRKYQPKFIRNDDDSSLVSGSGSGSDCDGSGSESSLYNNPVRVKISTFKRDIPILQNGPELIFSRPFKYIITCSLLSKYLKKNHVTIKLINPITKEPIVEGCGQNSDDPQKQPIDIIGLHMDSTNDRTRLVWSMMIHTRSSKNLRMTSFCLVISLRPNNIETASNYEIKHGTTELLLDNSEIIDHPIYISPPFAIAARKPKPASEPSGFCQKIMKQPILLWNQ